MKRDFFVNESSFSQVFQSEEQMTLQVGSDAKVVIPTPSLLFKAEFVRDGDDLILQNDGATDVRILDYFAASAPPDLVTAHGGQLSGAVVEKLAGATAPVQYAQSGPVSATNPIGQVETVEGNAIVQRADGTKEALAVGAKVYQNDVVSTGDGGKLSLTFVDGTMFTLASASRMVLDELVYTPDGDGNSATFSLVEGGFVFVAGQVAKTGEMQVDTPSSTMGIRGTTVLVDIVTREGNITVSVALTDDFVGGRGVIELRDLDGNLITTITDVDSKWVIPIDNIAYEVERTTEDNDRDAEILADAATAFAYAYNRVESGQNFVEFSSSSNATSSDGLSDFETGTDDGLGDETDGTESETNTDDGENGASPENGESPNSTDPTELEGNAGPGTTDPAVNVEEDGRLTGTLKALENDSNNIASFSIATPPQNGTVVLLRTGEFTYTPDKDFNGKDSFTYQVTDVNGETRTSTVKVTVEAVNDAPRARNLDTTNSEDTAVSGTVPTSDVDGDTLTHTVIGEPDHGTVKMDKDGNFTYTPDKDFNGKDSFTYQVSDGNGEVRSATVTVTVDARNDAPKARDLDAATNEDTAISGTVKTSDVDGDSLAHTIVGDPGHGTVIMDGDGNFTYTPDRNFNGKDSFTYQVTDGNGGTRTATVNIKVTDVNDRPKASDLDAKTDEDTAVSGTVKTSDADGDPLTHSIETDPSNGTVTMNGDGTFTYTPDRNFNGQDSFTYQVSDGNGGTRTATVTIDVAPENDAPRARDLDTTTDEDTSVSDTVRTSDVDGDTLTHVIATDPAHGMVEMDEDGNFTYTPDKDFNGEDSFTYQVSDGNGGIRTATVTIDVTPVNDAPEADDVFVKVETGQVIKGIVSATDVDSQSLQFTLGETGPSKGNVELGHNGTFFYHATDGATGFDHFEVDVSDGQDTVTVTVTVGLEDLGGAQADAQGLSVELAQNSSQDAPAGSATITRSSVDATPINIVFALDASGSFSDAFTDQIDAVRNAITALRQKFSGSNTQVDIKFVVFNAEATSSATFDLIDDAAAIETALIDIATDGARGDTDWAAALNEARAFFDTQNSQADEVDILFFITDGQTSNTPGQIGEALANLRDAHDVDILTFGIGDLFEPALLEQTYAFAGSNYEFDSDGHTVVLDTAADLTNALTATPLFNAQLVSFSLTLVSDGTDHGEIANQGSEGFTAVDLNFLLPFSEIDGIDARIGDVNDFQATAVFDLDGDTGTTSDQITLVSTERMSRPDAAVFETGDNEADLLLGGKQADTLVGGDGNDLLLGGGGNDDLRGQGGDDVLVIEGPLDADAPKAVADGGTGRDVLKIAVAGDLTSDVLPNLAITDIEAIDMTNGKANALALSLDDLRDLSSEPNSELEALLGSLPVTDSAVIYGDSGQTDTLTLTNAEGAIREGATVIDGSGNTLVVYEFLNSAGGVAGVLAVDDDVEVSGVIA